MNHDTMVHGDKEIAARHCEAPTLHLQTQDGYGALVVLALNRASCWDIEIQLNKPEDMQIAIDVRVQRTPSEQTEELNG